MYLLVFPYLRAEVVRSANTSLGIIMGTMQDPGDAKVANLQHLVLGDKDVLALDVSVQDFAAMNELNGSTHLPKEEEHSLFWQKSTTLPVDEAVEVAVLAKLHDDEHGAVGIDE